MVDNVSYVRGPAQVLVIIHHLHVSTASLSKGWDRSINEWRCRGSLSLGESVKPTVIADTPPDAGKKDSNQPLLYPRVFYSFTFYRLK